MSIFSLDIGTRSVVGILAQVTEKEVKIEELIYHEHESRSMLDGQIHNIPEVAKIVKQVKEELEQKSGKKISKVAVAAAGRSLKTAKATATYKNITMSPFTGERILALELEAVQIAQQLLLAEDNKATKYYCVGYSVINYYLDDNIIGSLDGQKAEKAMVEVVATFLPRVVVDSLQAVVKEAELELTSITLEPIAAINLVIPQTMRRLNLVLVDIGAGTSDIAICSKGTISAYGMVPIAGDEITEAICDQWLLDFPVGERVKRLVQTEENIDFTNVLGIPQTVTSQEIIDSMSGNVEKLAQAIAEEILLLNGEQTPQAVLCIGGGSQTPLLGKILAQALNLPKDRVAVQRAGNLAGISGLNEDNKGPDIITPIGIGVTAVRYPSMGFLNVTINEQRVQLLDLGKNLVVDALLSAGVNIKNLYGQPGLAKIIELNGKVKIFSGTMGNPAEIYLNGNKATLGEAIKNNDIITFIPGQKGKDAEISIEEIINGQKKHCFFNGKKIAINPSIKINAENISDFKYKLNDHDKVFVEQISLGDFLKEQGLNLKEVFLDLPIDFNSEQKIIPILLKEFKINNSLVQNINYILQDNDNIILKETLQKVTVHQVLDYLKINNSCFTVKLNGQKVNFTWGVNIKINDQNKDRNHIIQPNDKIQINTKKYNPPMVADFLAMINFEPKPPSGKQRLDIYLNGKHADYTSVLKECDEIQFTWN